MNSSGDLYAVILAGGKGERFWPLSTARRPKQLLALVGETTLLAQAVARLDGLIPPARVLVITHEELVAGARAAAPALPPENVIGEPVGRDTAAAVALAGALVKARSPDAVFCVLTADHVIGDLPVFRQTLAAAAGRAGRAEELITIGIRPDEPSSAYGYIEAAETPEIRDGIEFRRARRFVEKPDAATAAHYLARGNFFWNSGMFVWSVATLEKAFRRHDPARADLMERLARVAARPDRLRDELARVYPGLDKVSVDYALMEKADHIWMARGAFAWDDVGSWPALARHFPADAAGNVAVGEVAALDAAGNLVYSKDRLTALIGVRDLIVVQAEGVTLICPRDRSQEVKKLVAQLRSGGRHAEAL